MSEPSIIDRILTLFREKGNGAYFGEAISETEHGLQSAALAEHAGAPREVVAAALLHDIGHLLHNLPEDFADHGVDDRHEAGGSAWLKRHFPASVTDPIRLHVNAKRYLCTVEPAYHDALSEVSQRSFVLQGGKMNPDEVSQFEAEPFFRQAVMVRRWDDTAKVPNLQVPGLEHYRPILESLLVRGTES